MKKYLFVDLGRRKAAPGRPRRDAIPLLGVDKNGRTSRRRGHFRRAQYRDCSPHRQSLLQRYRERMEPSQLLGEN
jgi:hypothetical protein